MTSKILIKFLLASILGTVLISCKNEESDSNLSNLLTIYFFSQVSSTSQDQYTPDQANWETFSSKPFVNGTNTSHDPDGVGWLTAASWEAAKWDGTVYDPTKMTAKEFASAICPTADQIRGIREVFYANKPFADNRNPTKAEVDEWHRIAINHVRALVGYTSEDRQVKKDYCMFARALWGQERKYTTQWDAKYPEDTCDSSSTHCGASFIPDLSDQVAYLPAEHSGCTKQAGAEGVTGAPKSNIPWSIKWSRGFCQYLKSEGFWGGHVGPFFHREKFGFSFWDTGSASENNSNATMRGKWTGKLMESLYEEP